MALKVRLHRRARSDLRSIRDYVIRQAGSISADRVRSHLAKRMMQLSRLPFSGRPTSDPKVRLLSATRYPYAIYYTVKRSEVVVLHIRHTARRPPDDLNL
jgi:plasmid stabilization system protein ParE